MNDADARFGAMTQRPHIGTWQQFGARVRVHGCGLLRRLDEFPHSILVTGCQRSGTTILARVFSASDGMVSHWVGKDDELDGALILSGYVAHEPRGRYCFQTTYLNECYREYYAHDSGHKIIWVLRNPFSVVYSLMYHWKRFALNELFAACGAPLLDYAERMRYQRFGGLGVPKLRQACLAFNGKVSQVFELARELGGERMLVLDYDDMVGNKDTVLERVYAFVDLPYRPEYGAKIHGDSVRKADRLSAAERAAVEAVCMPVYERARALVMQP